MCPSPAPAAPSARGWLHPQHLLPPTRLRLAHPHPSQSVPIHDFAFLPLFLFFHHVQMGIKLRPLNSFALAAIIGLQAALHHQLFTAAACLWLENRSMLAPAAGARHAAACSLLGPCAGNPCGKAVLGLNPTRPNHTQAISFSCECARGQKAPLSSCSGSRGYAWPKTPLHWVYPGVPGVHACSHPCPGKLSVFQRGEPVLPLELAVRCWRWAGQPPPQQGSV